MRLAVTLKEVTPAEMLYELRVALMDRQRASLKQYHGIDFDSNYYVQFGCWFVQCWAHKYKNLVQNWQHLPTGADEVEGTALSKERLLKTAYALQQAADTTDQSKRAGAVIAAIEGATDKQSQSALTFLILCPEFLEALDADPACWREHTILSTLGSSYLAWDMRDLSQVERTRRIEQLEALLIYNLVGDAMFLPFGGSDGTEDDRLRGILSAKHGAMNATGLLALLANGNARRQFREQFPNEYKQLCERSLNVSRASGRLRGRRASPSGPAPPRS